MLVVPAIDIKGGKVVRLTQGLAEKEKVYSASPVDTAKRWESYGVKLIHVVDLDGALKGEIKNLKAIKDIAKAVKTKIEVGGGIRDIHTIERILDTGVNLVCIGTKAIEPKFLAAISKSPFRETVVISVDAKDGFIRTKGWVEKTDVKAVDLAKEAVKFGIKTINYTDISKDGMLKGPNIAGLMELLKVPGLDVVASGGITTLEDVKRLKALEKDGLKGMIIGKALYEGRIDLGDAMEICEGTGGQGPGAG